MSEQPRVLHHPRLIDGSMALVAIGSLSDYLPAVASALAVLWYAVQLWESYSGKQFRVFVVRKIFRRGPI
jgi:hypothetical protein